MAVVRTFLRLLIVLPLAAAALTAQTPPARPGPPASGAPPAGQDDQMPSIFPPIRVGVTNVTTPVTVVDGGGRFVHGLKPQDFVLFDNDVRQQISVEVMEQPISLVILIGNSDRLEPYLEHVRKTGIVFTDLLLGERGEAAVITYNHRVDTVQGFTNDQEQLGKTFKNLKMGGSQARLNDAVVRALTMLRDRGRDRRKVIVIIGEARDSGSETDLSYVLREAQLGGISIYAVTLSTLRTKLAGSGGPPMNAGPNLPPGARPTLPGMPPPMAQAQTQGNINLGNVVEEVVRGVKRALVDNPLQVYAEGTGGEDFGVFDRDAVEKAVAQISRELHSQYLVTYRPNNLNQAAFHKITVVVDRANVEVRARPGYYYPGGGDGAPAGREGATPGASNASSNY